MNNKKNILWLEDDIVYQNEMQECFGGVFAIAFVTNTKDAEEELKKNEYDLLIVDLHLSGGKNAGTVLVKKVKKDYPILPIIIVSSGRVREMIDAQEKGAKAILSKFEINIEEWVDVFNRYTKPKVFLSHSSVDKPIARYIKQVLKEYGISVWFDRDEISVGDSISMVISEKLEEANIVLIYLSEHSISSEWMEYDLRNIQKQLNYGKKIIPIVSDVKLLPVWLKDTYSIEIPDKNIDNSVFVEKLIKAITGVEIKHKSITQLRNQAEDESRPIAERIQLWNKVSDRLGDAEASAEEKSTITDKIIALKNQAGREANLKQDVLLEKFSIVDCLFYGKVDWTLHPRVNILLSENGMGKTTLLRLLTMMLSHDREIIQAEFKNIGRTAEIHLAAQRGDNLVGTTYQSGILDGNLRTVPCFAISDMRHLSKAEASVEEAQTMGVKLVSGANKHFMKKELDTDRFVNMLHLLVDEYRRSTAGKTFADIPVFQLITHILQELLGEMFQFANVPKNSISHLEVKTPNDEKPVALTQLSRGTNSVLYLFLSIWMHLRAVRDAKTELGIDTSKIEPHEITSIVIIDEIDAHLHPKWQRKIVGLLLDSFPNVQFIMASHSPLVVNNNDDGKVSILTRTENGIGISSFLGYTSALTIEDVYSNFFDTESLSETYDDETFLESIEDTKEDITSLSEEKEAILAALSEHQDYNSDIKNLVRRLDELNLKLAIKENYLAREENELLKSRLDEYENK